MTLEQEERKIEGRGFSILMAWWMRRPKMEKERIKDGTLAEAIVMASGSGSGNAVTSGDTDSSGLGEHCLPAVEELRSYGRVGCA